jgi:dTDP-4-dehydrorhamnose reductase
MTRWLVTGAGGMLGTDLVAALVARGEPVTGLDRASLDVTDAAGVTDAVARCRPAVVVNCAAWTAVDDAEGAEEQALAVNAGGADNLAAVCAALGARLVQVSTDYVFAGDARQPYAEDDVPSPRTAYGRTKLAGEQAVLGRLPGSGYVVRTAWLYGAHGPSFVGTMIRLESERPTVDVVDDQHGQPTWTVHVARQIVALVHSTAAPGIYHATSGAQTTWFGLAREIYRLLGADPARVRPIPSSALPRPAPRPAYSVLGHSAWAATGIPPIGEWRPALHRAFPELLTAQRPDERQGAPAGEPAGYRVPRICRLAQATQVGLAVSPHRQQPGLARLFESRGRGVFPGEHRFGVRRPLDADVRVKRMHAVLPSRQVRGRA